MCVFLLGSEFVKAVSGFRCQLCKTFMRHGHQIIQHLKGKKHNANYEVSFSFVFLLLCLEKTLEFRVEKMVILKCVKCVLFFFFFNERNI